MDDAREPRYRVIQHHLKRISKDLIELTVQVDRPFNFLPGQYVWLVLPECKDPLGNRRALSIISAPFESPTLRFLYRDSTSLFKKSLKKATKNAEMHVIGPQGSALVAPRDQKIPVTMIAGGAGIAPFLSHLYDVRHTQAKRKIIVHWFCKPSDQQMFDGDFLELNQSKNLRIITHNKRPGRGDLSDLGPSQSHYYITGPPGFVSTVSGILMRAKRPSTRHHFERTYPPAHSDMRLMEILKNIRKEQNLGTVLRDHRTNPEITSRIFRSIIEQTSNHVIVCDSNGAILFANRAAELMTGFSRKEMLGNTPRLWGGMMPKTTYTDLWRAVQHGEPYVGEFTNRRKNGDLYQALVRITPLLGDKGVYAIIATEEDITEHKRLEKSKATFVALASHQLQTPITAIKWYAELLLNRRAGALSTQQGKFVEGIQKESGQMIQRVNELLDASRVQLGIVPIFPKEVALKQIFSDALANVTYLAKQKRVYVSQKYVHLPRRYWADEMVLRSIALNLLSNAIQYSKERGKVLLEVRALKKNQKYGGRKLRTGHIGIKVEDHGIGIPAQEQSRIFTSFFRTSNALKNTAHGNGLGLFLIKTLVEKINGKIWFVSKENVGTTFYVLLPTAGIKKQKAVADPVVW